MGVWGKPPRLVGSNHPKSTTSFVRRVFLKKEKIEEGR